MQASCILLGMPFTASPSKEEVRKAYLHMSIKLHPDKHPEEGERYTELFQKMKQAYDYLTGWLARQPQGQGQPQGQPQGRRSAGKRQTRRRRPIKRAPKKETKKIKRVSKKAPAIGVARLAEAVRKDLGWNKAETGKVKLMLQHLVSIGMREVKRCGKFSIPQIAHVYQKKSILCQAFRAAVLSAKE
jgi:hypothetical protein